MGVILDEALPVLNVRKQYYVIFLELLHVLLLLLRSQL